MAVQLSPEHREARQTASEFAANELVPIAIDCERAGAFPQALIDRIAEANLRGFRIPEAYGGNGMDMLAHTLVFETFATAWPSAGFLLNEPVIRAVRLAGTGRQQAQFLPALCEGALGATAFSEPEHGSDFAAIETTAEREGDEYVIDGLKTWCGNAARADLLLVAVKTDPGASRRGISLFLVDTAADGIEIGPPIDSFVHRALTFRRVSFENCIVPAGNLLGEEDQGFYLAMEYLAESRIKAAAVALGIAAGAYAEALSYAQEREAFDRPISEFQSIRHKLADMETKIEAARHLVYRSAELRDADEAFGTAAARGKLYASRIAREVASEAVQIHGAKGLTDRSAVSMFYRDAKATEIYDGTSQIQRNIVAEDILDR